MLTLDLFNPCIKVTWYDVFQDVLFKNFTRIFLRVYNDIHDPKEWEEFIRLVLVVFGSRPTWCITPGWYELLPSENLRTPFNDVQISSSSKNFPTWALLNQSCSSLSTNTSISLKLSSSDFLLSLETFKTEDMFTFSHFGSRMICMWSPDSKMVHVYVHNFSVSFFRLLTCTNPTTLMDAKQWVVALF